MNFQERIETVVAKGRPFNDDAKKEVAKILEERIAEQTKITHTKLLAAWLELKAKGIEYEMFSLELISGIMANMATQNELEMCLNDINGSKTPPPIPMLNP